MAGQVEAAAEKLRAYLRELKPGARALLIAELERGVLHGTSPAGAELVLSELRRSLRDGQSKSARFGDPARLFFQPLEPFLGDDAPDHKHRARIARSALEPLWLWVSNTLIAEETKAYAEHVAHALMAAHAASPEGARRRLSDADKRIAETPYAVAVQIVLEEVDRRVRELAADLKSGRGIAVSALLKEVHDALRGLRSELDLSPESAWGKQLSTLRADVSRILTAEIELMPRRVRRLIRPRPSKEIVAGSKLDADEVTETEALIGFVATCRNYASELAINEITQRTFS